MLIFTTDVCLPGHDPAPDWPGPRVLAVLPGSGLDPAAPPDDAIVLEWLEPVPGLAQVLCEAVHRLGDLLRDGESPLLCLGAAPGPDDPLPDPDRVALHAIEARRDAAGRLTRLVLGEMVATSPLLPEALRLIAPHAADEGLFVELLTGALAWGDA
jgi:hypothetical protein